MTPTRSDFTFTYAGTLVSVAMLYTVLLAATYKILNPKNRDRTKIAKIAKIAGL